MCLAFVELCFRPYWDPPTSKELAVVLQCTGISLIYRVVCMRVDRIRLLLCGTAQKQ